MTSWSKGALAGVALAYLARDAEVSVDALDGLTGPVQEDVRALVLKARVDRAALAELLEAAKEALPPERLRNLTPRARTLAATRATPEERRRAAGFLENLPPARPGYSPPVALTRAMKRVRRSADVERSSERELRELRMCPALAMDSEAEAEWRA